MDYELHTNDSILVLTVTKTSKSHVQDVDVLVCCCRVAPIACLGVSGLLLYLTRHLVTSFIWVWLS